MAARSQFAFELSPAERERLHENAKREGVTAAEWLRRSIHRAYLAHDAKPKKKSRVEETV